MKRRVRREPEESPPPGAAWANLTWSDLEAWVGSRSLARARAYQRERRVSRLCISEAGVLLTWVQGGARYATRVQVRSAGRARKSRLMSTCSCPVGADCKHAAAVVVDYITKLEAGASVPPAPESDRRWATIAAHGSAPEDDAAVRGRGRKRRREVDMRALLDHGHPDEVLELGRELMLLGSQQIGRSDDAGETASAIGECMDVVLEALLASKRPDEDRILFAIDMSLSDDYGLSPEFPAVLHRRWKTNAWSLVADRLCERLEREPRAAEHEGTGRTSTTVNVSLATRSTHSIGRLDPTKPRRCASLKLVTPVATRAPFGDS